MGIRDKDIAMQVIGNMYDQLKVAKKKMVNVVVATSGDTGSAAIAALNNRKNINLFVLHPHNKISNVQRKIMTTIGTKNIFNIAIEGSFDDCQRIVKDLFNEDDFREKINIYSEEDFDYEIHNIELNNAENNR